MSIGENVSSAMEQLKTKALDLKKTVKQNQIIDRCITAHIMKTVDADKLAAMIQAELAHENLSGNDGVVPLLIKKRLGASLDEIRQHQRLYR